MHCCLSLLQGVVFDNSVLFNKIKKKLQQEFLNDCRKLGNFFTVRLTFLTKDVLSLAVVSHV